MAPRQARAAIRQAVAGWGLTAIASDAELLASELVSNAAEHGGGQPVTMTVRRHVSASGQARITCEISDTSPVLPQPHPAQAASERGRGLAIVAALATDSGIAARPGGKTAWFTLAMPQVTAQPERQAEAGA